MAIPANTVWEMRSDATANNANGGGFVTGSSGTDYSQQPNAQYNLTGVTSSGAGNTVLTAQASADMVGNIAHCLGGSGFTVDWFAIESVVPGVSITFGTNRSGTSICTGVGSGGIINIGGALSGNGSGAGISDDALFEMLVGGNKVWIKNGSYTFTTVTVGTAFALASNPIFIEGYNTTRGDRPTTDSGRPLINLGSAQFTPGNHFNLSYLMFVSNSTAGVISCGANNRFWWVKVTNTATTADRFGFNFVGASIHSQFYFCEAICYRGRAWNVATTNDAVFLFGCIARDSNVGFYHSGGSAHNAVYMNCLSYGNVSHGMDILGKTGGQLNVINCTFFGSTSRLGVGIRIQTGNVIIKIHNSIITGFVTGVDLVDASAPNCLDISNNYYNNTADVANWVKGYLTYAVNPNFKNVSTISGTTATTSGSVLTDPSADFSNVIDGISFVYISAGTGITAGKYKITAHTTTTITLDIAPGTSATADKVYQINLGYNFEIGANLKALGLPSSFPGDYTKTYIDIGAAQRKEPGMSFGSVG